MLWKCTICGLIVEGDTPPVKCPKCGQPAEKFVQLTKEEADKIYAADRTNDIHAEIIALSAKIIILSEEGININLDPPCVGLLTAAKNEAWIIKQRSKAEIESHVKKAKW